MFGTKQEAKILIQDHAVETRRNIKIIKDDGGRVRAICKGPLPTFEIREDGTQVGCIQQKHKDRGAENCKDKGKGPDLPKVKNVGGRGKKTNPYLYQCPWTLYFGKDSETESWMMKTLNTTHKCLQTRSINACTSTFLAKRLVDQVEENPEIPVRAVQEQFQRRFKVAISKMKAYRAKVKAKQQVEGDYFSQYELLWDYANEIKKANLGTTVRIDVEQPGIHTDATRKFRRIYVCYGALKEGFKALGRDLLGLDGAFMKGPFPGQILSAVSVDSNTGIYPVCFAIVEAENRSSWTWFLELLGEDMELSRNSNFTFISDRQKGLLPAFESLFPCAEHRFCLRHIH
ncbi:hypothetical protein QVD17_37954 [Tagetes erecta]|uniref:MULE transposase domain-containing protein n=1 Tax=Tagetes erecta TaxID=13708 RepID=A0AAD8ND54_TARER|nr:hypothetical protein QVD17_37954 [Tagetes erecta]